TNNIRDRGAIEGIEVIVTPHIGNGLKSNTAHHLFFYAKFDNLPDLIFVHTALESCREVDGDFIFGEIGNGLRLDLAQIYATQFFVSTLPEAIKLQIDFKIAFESTELTHKVLVTSDAHTIGIEHQ